MTLKPQRATFYSIRGYSYRPLTLLFLICFGFTAFHSTAHAANLYYNAAADTDWNNLANWWTDPGFSSPAPSLPGPTDDTFVSQVVDGNNGPAASVNTMVFSGPRIYISVTVGTSATFTGPYNYNAGTIIGTTTFNGTSYNVGTVSGNATFNNESVNYNTINGDAAFNNASLNGGTVTGTATYSYAHNGLITLSALSAPYWGGGTAGAVVGDDTIPITSWVFNDATYNAGFIPGNATFNDATYNAGSGVSGNATFNNAAFNDGPVTGTATFSYAHNGTITVPNGGRWGRGTSASNVGDDAIPITSWIFNGDSWNTGSISGTTTFNGTSFNNWGATVTGNTTFNDTAYNQGTISGNATFNNAAYNSGSVNGTATFSYAHNGTITIPNGGRWGHGTSASNVGDDAVPITSWIFNGDSSNSYGATVSGNAIFNDTSQNNSFVDGNAVFNGSFSVNNGTVSGTKTRRFSSDILSSLYYISDGPWTVLADGAVVRIRQEDFNPDPLSPTYTTFATANGGSFNVIPYKTYQASEVLGQPNFYSKTATDTNALGMDYPYGLVLDSTNHRLFVSQCGYRILVYALDSNNHVTSPFASYVLGQQDFTSNISTTTQSSLNCPIGLDYDSLHNRLFAADNSHSRVLIYDLSNGITNGMPASYVLGQPDFTSHQYNQGGTASSTTLGYVSSLVFAPQAKQLFVTDYSNNRVLVFDLSTGITNDMPASYVIGQQDFTSGSQNQGGTASSTTLMFPYAIAYDETHHHLFVDDDSNYRVLIYDLSNGITNGMAASYVLGQPDMNTVNNPTLNATSVNRPEELGYDAGNNRLFVGDDSYSRILVFDFSQGIINNMPAVGVIGAPDFTTNGYPRNGGGCLTTQGNICDPEIGMAYDPTGNRLWITDNSNNRALAFDLVKILGILANGTVGNVYSQTLSSTNSQGTVTYSVSSGSLPDGLVLNSSTGAITGTPTSASVGTHTFTIQVSDNNSDLGSFTDHKDFSITIAPGSTYSSGHSRALFKNPALPASSTNPLTPGTSVSPAATNFTHSLSLGSHSVDVLSLQKYLNTHGFLIALTGPGSPGHETSFYGRITRAAIIKFQKSHHLTPTGTVGPLTRALLNMGGVLSSP